MNKYDVIIVVAGPSGIFFAYELWLSWQQCPVAPDSKSVSKYVAFKYSIEVFFYADYSSFISAQQKYYPATDMECEMVRNGVLSLGNQWPQFPAKHDSRLLEFKSAQCS